MRRLYGIGLSLMSLAVCGCASEGGADGPGKYVPFTGTVTLDGKPTPGVIVSFLPDKKVTSDAGAGGFAVTDETGKFTMKYRGEKDGIPPGTYKATFSMFVLPDGKPLPPGSSAAELGAVEGISKKYSDPETSNMMVVINDAGGSQEFPLAGAVRKFR